MKKLFREFVRIKVGSLHHNMLFHILYVHYEVYNTVQIKKDENTGKVHNQSKSLSHLASSRVPTFALVGV